MSRTILFNMNGTLVPTRELAVQLYNDIAARQGYRQIRPEDTAYLSTLSVRDRCRWLQIPLLRMPLVGIAIKRRYQQDIPALSPPDGMRAVLHELDAQGFRLGLLTSNARSTTESFLNRNQLNVFEFVQYAPNPFGKSRSLSRLLHARQLQPARVLYVGDELRDIRAGRRAGVTTTAAAWGYDAPELLLAGGPDHLARQPADLLAIAAGGPTPLHSR